MRALVLALVLVLLLPLEVVARNKIQNGADPFHYARGTVGVGPGGAITFACTSGDERTYSVAAHNQHSADLILCASSVDCSAVETPAVNSAGGAWTMTEGAALVHPGEWLTLDRMDTGGGARMVTSTGSAEVLCLE